MVGVEALSIAGCSASDRSESSDRLLSSSSLALAGRPGLRFGALTAGCGLAFFSFGSDADVGLGGAIGRPDAVRPMVILLIALMPFAPVAIFGLASTRTGG